MRFFNFGESLNQKTLRGKRIGKKILSINKFDFYNYEKNISDIIIKFCNEKEIIYDEHNAFWYLKFAEEYHQHKLKEQDSELQKLYD
ncbi:MAG: hypothetical protein ACPHKR_09475, partial [bacterium]